MYVFSKTSEIDNLKEQIEESLLLGNSYREERSKREQTLKILLDDLQKLHQCINPLAEPQENALLTLQQIEADLEEIFRRLREAEGEEKVCFLIYIKEKYAKHVPFVVYQSSRFT